MTATRIIEYDTWRPGYGFAVVQVLIAGTGTLASIYSDEALTVAVTNPITLLEKTDGGISYGKFSAPVYVGVPFELLINSVDTTGVTRPALTSLDDEDGSEELVTVEGGTEAITLEAHLARRIDVRDYGDFLAVGSLGASATANTNTLIAALGVAGAHGGGFVEIPSGTFAVTSYTIPQGVVMRGQGRSATILQSTTAGNCCTIGGVRAGMSRLTWDGVSQVATSIGVYIENKDQVVFDDVEVKRFETGIHRKAGGKSLWFDLYISNCVNGYLCDGVTTPVSVEAQFNAWIGGKVDTCTTIGIRLKHDGNPCEHNTFEKIFFDTNTGTAFSVLGARKTVLRDCRFAANTTNLVINDNTPATTGNTVIGFEFAGGYMSGGIMTLTGTLQDVAFRRVDFTTVAVTITTPKHNVLVQDCREITGNSFAGTATAWVRNKTTDKGWSTGVTTGATATKAWSVQLVSGQKVYLEAKVIGRQRNGIGTGFYHVSVSAGRVGASLAYGTQTANFTAGLVVTGATSGATARITADSDAGASGTLTVQDIVGTFVDTEIITDTGGGSAACVGTISESNAALIGAVTSIRAAQETDAGWDATFVANGPDIELRVTGNANLTVEWTVDVEVLSNG